VKLELCALFNTEFIPRHANLVIEHRKENFVGTLRFDDAIFCWHLTMFLRKHIGRSIQEIGGLDVSFMA
jgi:hypothetical protein